MSDTKVDALQVLEGIRDDMLARDVQTNMTPQGWCQTRWPMKEYVARLDAAIAAWEKERAELERVRDARDAAIELLGRIQKIVAKEDP